MHSRTPFNYATDIRAEIIKEYNILVIKLLNVFLSTIENLWHQVLSEHQLFELKISNPENPEHKTETVLKFQTSKSKTERKTVR